jgi:DNA-binding response OmpR family regulator
VFMSGYTDNVLAERGLQETGAAFLPKPFSHDELAAKVRAALDAHAARATSR